MHPVLIIGGGPSGLAAALTLTQNGCPVVPVYSPERWRCSASLACSMMYAASIRPKDAPGNIHVSVLGQTFDPAHLLYQQEFVSFVKEKKGCPEFVFKKFTARPKVMMVKKFYNGRVFIVGDAAHIHSPSGGQGLNTSVQDSFNLCWKLALVHKRVASLTLLSTYETERQPVVALMLATTSNLYQHLVARKGEDLDASPQDKLALIQWRSLALRQYEINYRWSPLVQDIRPGLSLSEDELKAHAYEDYPSRDVRAGDRAPDALALVGADGAETALFSIFKPYYHSDTVLVFAPEGANVAGVIKAAAAYPKGLVRTAILGRNGVPAAATGADVVYHDKGSHAPSRYHVTGDGLTLVVVRPDGHMGGFVHDVEDLQTYFPHIFS